MINCHSCRTTDGVLVGYCNECEIRLCALEKAVPHCGACPDYACKRITDFHAMCPGAAENLKQEMQRG
ncbi:DUF3795 domain-containing protein [Brucepastera parasyntrophica]|uniref:DUF3795 domain-containing protein n=1 Tax=Brucepastera parasyntrophica TaxID=2880008 RepID=UPI003F72FD31|nr:DUF3795 domain-containing protein [Brucepastera parasyntrophica]